MNRLTKVCGALLVAVALLSGCTKDSTGSEKKKFIDEEGGSLTVRFGDERVSVEVPPGAVPPGDEVKIIVKQAGQDEFDGFRLFPFAPVGEAYLFEPEGQQFLVPVTITIPWDPALLPAGVSPDNLTVLVKNNQTGAIDVVQARVSGNTLSVDVDHFSTFMAVVSEQVPDTVASAVTVDKTEAVADGEDAILITVDLLDTAGVPMAFASLLIEVTGRENNLDFLAGETDELGRIQATLRSTGEGFKTIVVRTGGPGARGWGGFSPGSVAPAGVGLGVDPLNALVLEQQPVVEFINVIPTLTVTEDLVANEGELVGGLIGSFTDTSPAQTHTATIDWGDGDPGGPDVIPAAQANGTAGTINQTHVYATEGDYLVTVTLADSAGDASTLTFTITVANLPPVVEAGPHKVITSGQFPGLEASFTDPGTLDEHLTTGTVVDWGDGTGSDVALTWIPFIDFNEAPFGPPGDVGGMSGTITRAHGFAQPGEYLVTVTVQDDGGLSGSDTLMVVFHGPVEEAEADLDPAVFFDPNDGNAPHTATINWGDGTPTEPGVVNENDGTVSGTHVYARCGTYTVTVTVIGADGGTEVSSYDLEVLNNAPEVVAGEDQEALEGEPVMLAPATFTDLNTLDTHTATIDWGDGSPVEVGVLNEKAFGPPGSLLGMNGTVFGTHVYADNGNYTVEITVTDVKGESGSDTLTVQVHNVEPELQPVDFTPLVGNTVCEGDTVCVSSTYRDAGTLDTHEVVIDWGDGIVEAVPVSETPYGPPGSTRGMVGLFSACHNYADSGNFTIEVRLRDDDMTTNVTAEIEVMVENKPPVVEAGIHRFITEGETILLDPASFVDPAGFNDTYTATIDWDALLVGDTGAVTPTATGGLVDGSFTFEEDGFYVVTVTVEDSDGAAGSDTFEVTVENATPEFAVGGIPGQLVCEGDLVAFSVNFSDEGVLDTHTATIDWGDGTSPDMAAVSDFIAGEHVYADDGLYTVTVFLEDDEAANTSTEFKVFVENKPATVFPRSDLTQDLCVYRFDTIHLTDLVTESTFNDPGTLDTHTAWVDWGDGTVDVVEITYPVAPFGPPGSVDGLDGQLDARHAYDGLGNFTVTITVVDDEGAEAVGTFQVDVCNRDPHDLLQGLNCGPNGEVHLDLLAGATDPDIGIKSGFGAFEPDPFSGPDPVLVNFPESDPFEIVNERVVSSGSNSVAHTSGTNFVDFDWTYEVTLILGPLPPTSSPIRNTVVGVGPLNGGLFNNFIGGRVWLTIRATPSRHQVSAAAGIGTVNGGSGLSVPMGRLEAGGPHRARMSKTGHHITLEVDEFWDGERFVADLAATIDLTDRSFLEVEGLSLLEAMNDGNTPLHFADLGVGSTFDDLCVQFASSTPDVLSVAEPIVVDPEEGAGVFFSEKHQHLKYVPPLNLGLEEPAVVIVQYPIIDGHGGVAQAFAQVNLGLLFGAADDQLLFIAPLSSTPDRGDQPVTVSPVRDLEADPARPLLYATDGLQLHTLNPFTGETVGSRDVNFSAETGLALLSLDALEFDANGRLLGIARDTDDVSYLVVVDLENATADTVHLVVVGPTLLLGLPFPQPPFQITGFQGLALDPSGHHLLSLINVRLFVDIDTFFSLAALVEINPMTGEACVLVIVPVGTPNLLLQSLEFTAGAISEDEQVSPEAMLVAGGSDGSLYRLNLETSTVRQLAELRPGEAITGLAQPCNTIAPRLVVEEVEPDNAHPFGADVQFLGRGQAGVGDLDGDEFWVFSAQAGELIEIEVHAARLNQLVWGENRDLALIEIFDDGLELLQSQTTDFFDELDSLAFDLGFPVFQAPNTGTFFIRVRNARLGDALQTGRYAITLRTQLLGGRQVEAGDAGDIPEEADALDDGTCLLIGEKEESGEGSDDTDFYSFEIVEATKVRFELSAFRNGTFHENVFLDDDANEDDQENAPQPTLRLWRELNPGGGESVLELVQESVGRSPFYPQGHSLFLDGRIEHLLEPGTYYIEVLPEDGFTLVDLPYHLFISRQTMGEIPTLPLEEVELNDSIADAEGNPALHYGQCVGGSIDHADDADFFRFEGQAGDMVQVQLFDRDNYDLGAEDLRLDLFDAQGVLVCSTFGLREAAPTNGAEVGLQMLRAILPHMGTFYFSVQANSPTQLTPPQDQYAAQLKLVKRGLFEWEPNNFPELADPLSPQRKAAGVIASGGDLDTFCFGAQAGELVTLSIYAEAASSGTGDTERDNPGSELRPILEVYDANGFLLADATYSAPAPIDRPEDPNDFVFTDVDGTLSMGVAETNANDQVVIYELGPSERSVPFPSLSLDRLELTDSPQSVVSQIRFLEDDGELRFTGELDVQDGHTGHLVTGTVPDVGEVAPTVEPVVYELTLNRTGTLTVDGRFVITMVAGAGDIAAYDIEVTLANLTQGGEDVFSVSGSAVDGGGHTNDEDVRLRLSGNTGDAFQLRVAIEIMGDGDSGIDFEPIIDFQGLELTLSLEEGEALPPAVAESNTEPLPTMEVTFLAPETGVYFLQVADEEGDGGECFRYLIERRGAAIAQDEEGAAQDN